MATAMLGLGRRPSLSDLRIVGVSLVRKHDRGELSEATTNMYTQGVKQKYGLSEDETRRLKVAMLKPE